MRPKYAFLLLISLLLLSFGCQGKKSKIKPLYLRLCLVKPVRTLDPHVGTECPSVHIIKMLHEGLMVRALDGSLEHGLAESYRVSDDQKTYTFVLKDAQWSNGDPLTAYDFERSWKKAIDSDQYGAMLFSPIKNAGECSQGEVGVDSIGVQAVDSKTLRVVLERPTPYFLELTAYVNFSPKHHKRKVYSGPFMVDKWEVGKKLILKRNPRYWDAKNVLIDGVHIRIVSDPGIRHHLFEKGKLDWIGDPLSPLSMDAIECECVAQKVKNSELNGMNWLVFNTEMYPFNNVNLRRALSCAISRQEIVNQLAEGSKSPALGIFREGKNYYIPDGNRLAALMYFKAALKELGISREDFPKIVLSYSPSYYEPHLMHLIQNQWEETLGIQVKLDPLDKVFLYNKMKEGTFQIGSMFWVSIIQDPVYVLDFFRSPHAHVNMSQWNSPDYMAHMERIDKEVDLSQREELIDKAEAMILDEVPVVPLCYASALHLQKEGVENVGITPNFDLHIKHAKINRKNPVDREGGQRQIVVSQQTDRRE